MAIKVSNNTIITDDCRASFNQATFINSSLSTLGPFSPVQGTSFGYATGGGCSDILRTSFTSDTNATCVGALGTTNTFRGAGASSKTHGYSHGGEGAPGSPQSARIDKFLFTNETCNSNIGSLVVARAQVGGHSSETHGYASGGCQPQITCLDKYPFSTDTNASSISALCTANRSHGGNSSKLAGYIVGGLTGTNMQKFPFATETVTETSSVLTRNDGFVATNLASSTAGYMAGGGPSFPYFTTIDKYPFATDRSTGTVGDLAVCTKGAAGSNSREAGYVFGNGPPTQNTCLQKYIFASDVNASCIGTTCGWPGQGQQV